VTISRHFYDNFRAVLLSQYIILAYPLHGIMYIPAPTAVTLQKISCCNGMYSEMRLYIRMLIKMHVILYVLHIGLYSIPTHSKSKTDRYTNTTLCHLMES
jgi:hypothetical protein